MKKKIFLDGPRAPRPTILKKNIGALGTRMAVVRYLLRSFFDRWSEGTKTQGTRSPDSLG